MDPRVNQSLDHWGESDSHGVLDYDGKSKGYDQQSGQAATTKPLGTSPAETGGRWRVDYRSPSTSAMRAMRTYRPFLTCRKYAAPG